MTHTSAHEHAGSEWTKTLHERIALAVRDARTRRGVSAQQLAEATARLGYPISRNQIANYETGRKQTLDVAELLVLAMALQVPPITLLFGGHPDATLEVTPGQEMPVIDAVAWFSADERLADDVVVQPDTFEAKVLKLARSRAEKQRMALWAKRVATRFAEKGDEGEFPAMDHALRLMGEIDETNDAIATLIANADEGIGE